MALILLTQQELHAIVVLKIAHETLAGFEPGTELKFANFEFTENAFYALLRAGLESDIQFAVSAARGDPASVVCLRERWQLDPESGIWSNPAWQPEPSYQVQVRVLKQIMYHSMTDREIATTFLSRGRVTLLRMLGPTPEQIAKYHLEATEVPGVYHF